MSDNIMPPEELDQITRPSRPRAGHQQSHATGPEEVTFSTSLTYLSGLAPEAFHGWLGQWVRTLAPHTEGDPAALVGLSLGALGHCARRARVQGQPLKQLMVLVGDGRAGSEAAWDHVDRLFSRVSEGWKEGVQLRTLPPCRDWPRLVDGWDGKGIGKGTFLGTSRPEEIRDLLTKQQASDLASRTLLLRMRGGTPQPFGERFPLLDNAVKGLRNSLDFARGLRELDLAPEAEKLWVAMYSVLREPRNAGAMIDIMTELAARRVLRLAGLYAIVDRSPEIKPDHLLAALAVWDHHEETLRELFGNQTGNKKQDAILRSLRERHPTGLTTSEINSTVLQGNARGGSGPILEELEHAGLIYSQEEPANGRGKRPAHRWFLTQAPDIGINHSYLGIAQAILRQNSVESFRRMENEERDGKRRGGNGFSGSPLNPIPTAPPDRTGRSYNCFLEK